MLIAAGLGDAGSSGAATGHMAVCSEVDHGGS